MSDVLALFWTANVRAIRHSASFLLLSVLPVCAQAQQAKIAVTPAAGALPSPKVSCEALAKTDFTKVQDAPAEIVQALVIEAHDKDPAYCEVQGYVYPQVKFEIDLPLSGWNGKFMEVGDGGWAGEMFLFLCDGPLRSGYACIASDMGHGGSGALWANNNLPAQIDYGYRATHVTALIGKAIINQYYARAPSKSIMFGCSTGGYQGMVEAQRFPWDFDGIVAMSPDMDSHADVSMRVLWNKRHLIDKNGKPLFTSTDLQLLHNAALAQCDMTDGVKDGIIGNPLKCAFEPGVLTCKPGQTSGCLSAQQIDSARKIYSTVMTSSGKSISTRGVFPGSELLWKFTEDNEATQLFKYGVYGMSSPSWKMSDFDFDQDYKRLGMGAISTDNNPDLRKFKAAGGKLIAVQGGNDPTEPPGALFDYYDIVERTMGGQAATQDFFRLFLVPGMNHCSGGDGAFAIDYLAYIEDWVEKDRAPEVMIGGHVEEKYLIRKAEGLSPPGHFAEHPDELEEAVTYGTFLYPFPLESDLPISFTRPVYPYPFYAKYKGKGDPNKAKKFEPVQ